MGVCALSGVQRDVVRTNLPRMRDDYFHIDFEAPNPKRFDRLKRIFCELKRLKDECIESENSTDASKDADDMDWQSFLGDEEIAWFSDVFDFSSAEGRTWRKLWDMTAPTVRLSHPLFNTPGNWTLEGAVDSILCCDYQLIELVRRENGQGTLSYDPWGGPFGGSESLVALLEGFGCEVTHDSWHGGPHAPEIGWDYQLAKHLVDKGERISLARQLDPPKPKPANPWWKFWA